MKKLIRKGKVCAGQVVLPFPLPLEEGTEVTVEVKPAPKQRKPKTMTTEEFLSLPFFGMWADREDMKDSVEWVNKERAKWSQRSKRKD